MYSKVVVNDVVVQNRWKFQWKYNLKNENRYRYRLRVASACAFKVPMHNNGVLNFNESDVANSKLATPVALKICGLLKPLSARCTLTFTDIKYLITNVPWKEQCRNSIDDSFCCEFLSLFQIWELNWISSNKIYFCTFFYELLTYQIHASLSIITTIYYNTNRYYISIDQLRH